MKIPFPEARLDSGGGLRVGEVLSALSYALDLTEGQPLGHSVRCCVIGMHLAREIGLSSTQSLDLYYALLLKDAGCSSNASRMFQILSSDEIAAKRDVKTTDWTQIGWESLEYALNHVRRGAPFLERVRALVEVAINNKREARELVQIRCERGSHIARHLGTSEATAQAIYNLDELWDGRGHPRGLRGDEIPLLARLLNLAQNVDVFYMTQGAGAALDMARRRAGRWFDPALVKALQSAAQNPAFWPDVDRAAELAPGLEPTPGLRLAGDDGLDTICLTFADVIDAKSPFTFQHSLGVARAATAIAAEMGLPAAEIKRIERAALLHDIGKLGVSNSILDKPGKLTAEEFAAVKKHPFHTYEILCRTPGLRDLALLAASHHEKLDGTGYHRGVDASQLDLPSRILVVADIFDALHAKRPYRDALPAETVLAMLEKDAPRALDPACIEALRYCAGNGQLMADDLLRLTQQLQPAPALAPAERP